MEESLLIACLAFTDYRQPAAGSRLPATGCQLPMNPLASIIALTLAVASCAPLHTSPFEGECAELERETFALVNAHRASIGKPPLVADARIAAIARRQSVMMARRERPFGHDYMERRTRAVKMIVAWERVGENLEFNNAAPASAARKALDDWLKSPGHRATLEDAFELTGIGVARDSAGIYFFTQLFVQSAEPFDP